MPRAGSSSCTRDQPKQNLSRCGPPAAGRGERHASGGGQRLAGRRRAGSRGARKAAGGAAEASAAISPAGASATCRMRSGRREDLANQQKDIQAQVDDLNKSTSGARRAPGSRAAASRSGRIRSTRALAACRTQLEKLANDAPQGSEGCRAETGRSGRRHHGQARAREDSVHEAARCRGKPSEYARGMESDIGSNLDALKKQDWRSAVGARQRRTSRTRCSAPPIRRANCVAAWSR